MEKRYRVKPEGLLTTELAFELGSAEMQNGGAAVRACARVVAGFELLKSARCSASESTWPALMAKRLQMAQDEGVGACLADEIITCLQAFGYLLQQAFRILPAHCAGDGAQQVAGGAERF